MIGPLNAGGAEFGTGRQSAEQQANIKRMTNKDMHV
jgi:hypothetical protein